MSHFLSLISRTLERERLMAPEGCVEQAWVRGPSSADCLKAIRTETGCRGPHCRRARS